MSDQAYLELWGLTRLSFTRRRSSSKRKLQVPQGVRHRYRAFGLRQIYHSHDGRGLSTVWQAGSCLPARSLRPGPDRGVVFQSRRCCLDDCV
jgi:hypothetical protein